VADTHILFISKPTGYELRQGEGDPPPVGAALEIEETRYFVSKIGSSPLPQDRRPCAYLQRYP
jgi:hypothetical protein